MGFSLRPIKLCGEIYIHTSLAHELRNEIVAGLNLIEEQKLLKTRRPAHEK